MTTERIEKANAVFISIQEAGPLRTRPNKGWIDPICGESRAVRAGDLLMARIAVIGALHMHNACLVLDEELANPNPCLFSTPPAARREPLNCMYIHNWKAQAHAALAPDRGSGQGRSVER
ncbi:hypothetical protein E4U55_002073 [Claviceps digitariae]|nr:hypothetical protein E4U55_002073 [Claviceps digitariae]